MSTVIGRPRRFLAQRNLKLRNHPRAECLEERSLLTSGVSSTLVSPALGSVLGPFALGGPPTSAYTPALMQSAYGFNQISFGNGTIKGDGTGQTIAIVDAYDSPTISSDLAKFDAAYGLPAPPSFTKLDQNGGTTYPWANANWGLEIALDVEWAHAMAPGANLVLVEANSASTSDLMQAVKTAAGHASVVSMSWGGPEFAGETQYDALFGTPGVTFVTASGDSGGIFGASFPSSSPNVVSVGGTTLNTNASGAWTSETAWSGFLSQGSGGGVSRIEPLPSFQASALGSQYAKGRVSPDIAYNANPNSAFFTTYSGYAVYDSFFSGGWSIVGGTSAGSPQIAAMIAIADQGRALSSLPALSSHDTLAGILYANAATLNQSSPSPYFHDITVGFTAAGFAKPGYDRVTGLGSPIANALVAYAVGYVAPSITISAPQATVTPPHSAPSPSIPTVVVFVPFVPRFLAGVPYIPIMAPLTAPTLGTSEGVSTATVGLNAASSSLSLPPQPVIATSSGGFKLARDRSESPLFDVPLEADLVPSASEPWFLFKNAPARPPAPAPDAPAPPKAPEKQAVPDAPPAVEKTSEIEAFQLWDAALHSYVVDTHGEFGPLLELDTANARPPVELTASPRGESEPDTGAQAAWAVGTAVALWSLWEYRARSSESRRRPFDAPV